MNRDVVAGNVLRTKNTFCQCDRFARQCRERKYVPKISNCACRVPACVRASVLPGHISDSASHLSFPPDVCMPGDHGRPDIGAARGN